MIVPMKKVSILIMDKEREPSLQKIRELGILHLKNKTASSPALTKLMDRHAQIDIALHVLGSFPHKKGEKIKQTTYSFACHDDLIDHVLELYDRQKAVQDYIFQQQRERENLKKWGDFKPESFKYLIDNGVKAYLYELSPASYKENVGDVPIITISRDKKSKLILLIAFDEIPNETPLSVPKRCISEINERNEIRQNELTKIEAELVDLWCFKDQLDAEKNAILADIEFETVRAGMSLIDEELEASNQDVPVSWVSGYVPAPELKQLKQAATENGWALCADDPAEDDIEVPTKLKNNRIVSLIYPLTKFLEIHPSYRETDVSWLFLIFFTLFFGMLFGDAGYGSILALIAGIGIFATAKKGVPLFFKFLLLMSVSTITWGVLTCAWFGVDITKVPILLQSISLPLITNVPPELLVSYNANNFWIASGFVKNHEGLTPMINANLMFFCFSIALVHLSIARIKRIIMHIRSLKVFGEIGALGMLFGMYFVVLSLVVYKTGFPGVKPWQIYCIAGGFALVFVFGKYEGSIVKGLIESCTNSISIVLGIANVFSDIMSYIRLWAVGVAGASLAATINSGADTMLGSLVFFVFGVLLLLFGHAFNMTLNTLAVLVHGVRLNTLEFSSNLGLSWAGFEYKPFAKR